MMNKSFNTDQEAFWAGEFGNDYIARNSDKQSIAHRTAVFSKILSRTVDISSILEIGANIGHNIIALKNLLPDCSFSAVEINNKAVEQLRKISDIKIHHGSIMNFSSNDIGKHDLTFTSGVLIHIAPDMLNEVYSKLYECSTNYILIYEYYNPIPVEVNYRGYSEKLFKRDFAGEIMDKYNDLELIDYGFQYHRDNNFPCDDSTWFLMRKKRL